MNRFLVTCLLAPTLALAQAPFPTSPDWTSSDTEVSTGAAMVDLDRDGWLDLVVANGNDMETQRLVVYYNTGNGSLPLSPDWQSDDTAYNGHLDVADVNGDGWPDVAVAVLGRYSDVDPEAKLYLNNGGTLSTLPDWQAAVEANAFGCAFGDVNNDGRPDLAVATGWAYDPQNHYANRVYLNSGGSLETTASWSSTDTDHLQGVLWVDADQDGWLDLAGAASGSYSRIYRNTGGTLETTASWQTADGAAQDAIMLAAGDVSGDGVAELFITDNIQLGASGDLRQYDGMAGDVFATSYSWSTYQGYGSAVALADVTGDGSLDLVEGSWWGYPHLFVTQGGGLGTSPVWTSNLSSVVERMVFGDLDRSTLVEQWLRLPADGHSVFVLPYQPIQEVLEVQVDGAPLTPDRYVVSREHGWVSVDAAPATALELHCTRSWTPDMAVTNWDNNVGNHVYMNTNDPPLFADGFESGGTATWSATIGGTASASVESTTERH
jgi:hypothetical protein